MYFPNKVKVKPLIYYNVIVQSFPSENLPLDVSTRWEIYAHHLLVTVVPPPVEVGEILFRVICKKDSKSFAIYYLSLFLNDFTNRMITVGDEAYLPNNAN